MKKKERIRWSDGRGMKPVMVRSPFRPPKCVRNVSERERATDIPFEATLSPSGFEQHADDRHVVIRPAVVGAQWREEGGGGGRGGRLL